jgi:hypothetical protein
MEDGPSLWGHERRWGTEEMRNAARALRLGAGAKGLRAPVQVVEGNHALARGECAWWDAAVRARSDRDASEPLQKARETEATPATSRLTRPRGRESPSAW